MAPLFPFNPFPESSGRTRDAFNHNGKILSTFLIKVNLFFAPCGSLQCRRLEIVFMETFDSPTRHCLRQLFADREPLGMNAGCDLLSSQLLGGRLLQRFQYWHLIRYSN